MIKFKQGPTPYSFYKIYLDDNGREVSRQSFSENARNMTAGYFLNIELPKWIEAGNKIEPESTPEEQLEKEQKLKSDLYDSIKKEFGRRITQSDKIATLLSIGDNYLDITVERLLTYKQDLRSYYNTLSIDSPLEELQNPFWPEKITEKELL